MENALSRKNKSKQSGKNVSTISPNINKNLNKESGNKTEFPLFLQRAVLSSAKSLQNIQSQAVDEEQESSELQNTGGHIQAKLTLGGPEDEYEREADQVAEAIMRLPDTNVAQTFEEEEGSQQSNSSPNSMPTIQPKGGGEHSLSLSSQITKTVQSPSRGSPLPKDIQSRVVQVLGKDVGHVRVHSDMQANKAADSLNAKAFTHQNHIYLGKGQSVDDSQLMAHELTHVVQQSGGIKSRAKATPQISSVVSPRISRWSIDVPGGVAKSDRKSDTLWGLARILTRDGSLWPLIIPIHMQSPLAGSGEFWRYIWIGDTFSISPLVLLAGYLPWSPNTMVTFLSNRGDQTVIEDLLNVGYRIVSFRTAYFNWRYNNGTETEDEATGLYGATCVTGLEMGCSRGAEILIRSGLLTNEAASTLFHERGHVISTEPAYLEQEIQVRIDEEEFRIRHNMPSGGQGYRNPDGTVNEAAIRQSVMTSSVYNPTNRTMIGMWYEGRRRTGGWARLLRVICP